MSDSRADRFRAVGEVLGLYEELERELERNSETELARLVAASREGELALAESARRLERFLVFKRRFETMGFVPYRADGGAIALREPADEPSWDFEEPPAFPYLWEAVAFVTGFAVASWLLI